MIRRRSALGMMGAAAGLVALGSAPRASQAAERKWAPPDMSDRQQVLRAYRKLAYSLDDAVTFWWMRGRRFGVVDSVATPFWDMYVGAWFRTRDLDNESYEVTVASANFYTPPDSTKLLEVFRNPYTADNVPVPYNPPRAWRTVMGPQGGSPFGVSMPGMTTTDLVTDKGPGYIEGDDVVIRGDMMIRAVPTEAGPDARPFVATDWSTYVGTVADVADPRVTNPPSAQYFTDILTWPAWLQMGDQPGSFYSYCFGRKVFAYEGMPALWRNLFEQAFPESAQDPYGVLDEA